MTPARLLRGLACAAPLLGCSSGLELPADPAPAAARLHPELGGLDALGAAPSLPAPAADGPKLAPLAFSVRVHARPSRTSPEIGTLRLGARVARSEEPVGREGCPEGWYAIWPAGYVCRGPEASTDLSHPVARAVEHEPDRSAPMPYRYAFVRAIAPNYLRVPTAAEQERYEMRLDRHLRNWKRLRAEWDVLDVGANDVPLDAEGRARGAIPEAALPLDASRRYGGDGSDDVPWWLRGERRIPNLSSFKAPSYAVIADRIKRHAGVALIDSFVSGKESGERRFAVTTDARLIPADKLKADSGSPFHGVDLRAGGLPVAFARRRTPLLGAGGEPRPGGGALGAREVTALTGDVTVARRARLLATRGGDYVRSEDVAVASRPGSFPWFADGQTRWIDVSIVAQTLVLWEGRTPVYATLVSTGRDGLGDPRTTHSTPTGTFRIYRKHVTTTMDSELADQEFELRDVPWVMYFKGGYALHGAYWHDQFGSPRSHGCVNLAPIDARVVFRFTSPEVPEHWHSTSVADEVRGGGTWVNVRP